MFGRLTINVLGVLKIQETQLLLLLANNLRHRSGMDCLVTDRLRKIAETLGQTPQF